MVNFYVSDHIWGGKTLKELSEAHINDSGIAVLGHHPGYIDKAIGKKASYYDIGDVWKELSDIERKAANRHFLDVIAERGDQILLSTSKLRIRAGSSLADEVRYLVGEKGYRWVNQWSLVRP